MSKEINTIVINDAPEELQGLNLGFNGNKYYVLLDENGQRTSPTYLVTDKNIPEDIKQNGVVVDKLTQYALLNGYQLDVETGTLSKIPPHVDTLEETKSKKKAEITAAYVEAVNKPVWVEQDDGNTYGYDTDKDSQIDFNSSYQRALIDGQTRYNVYTNPEDLSIKVFTVHTPDMFKKALSAAGDYQEDVYAKYYALKAAIENAETKEEVSAIVWQNTENADEQGL